MKKWSIIIAAALVGLWLVVSTIHEFFGNETIHYFYAAPHCLLYVGAIAVAGGVAALVFSRLSPRARRGARLVSSGGAAGLLTVFWCYMLYQITSSSELILRNAGVGWMVVALAMWTAIAAYLWFEFFRTWKAGLQK